jgi:hypothetical protein
MICHIWHAPLHISSGEYPKIFPHDAMVMAFHSLRTCLALLECTWSANKPRGYLIMIRLCHEHSAFPDFGPTGPTVCPLPEHALLRRFLRRFLVACVPGSVVDIIRDETTHEQLKSDCWRHYENCGKSIYTQNYWGFGHFPSSGESTEL